jgi:hypothetical protein
MTENVKQNLTPDQLEDYYFFQSPIYKIDKKQFLDIVSEVANESLKVVDNEIEYKLYPVNMSGDFSSDARVLDFSQYVLSTAWNILKAQGYAMDLYDVGYTSMWLQDHHKSSNMEQHVHSDSHIVAFYFIDVPENGCQLIVHDPRPGKVQIDLMQENMSDVSLSSRMVVINPEPGDLIFTNSWLPHSFSRNGSEESTKFVHMNIVAFPVVPNSCETNKPEII